MKLTKMFFSNKYIGSFQCDGGRYTKFQKAVRWFKHKLLISAKVCIVAWLIVGGLKVGQHFAPQPIVYAEKIVEVESTKEAPVLTRIAKCESGNKHIGSNGQVILNANTNGSVDVGVMQINERIWGKKATELGLNLWVEKDNRAFGKYLYDNFGTEPWVWSKACWNK